MKTASPSSLRRWANITPKSTKGARPWRRGLPCRLCLRQEAAGRLVANLQLPSLTGDDQDLGLPSLFPCLQLPTNLSHLFSWSRRSSDILKPFWGWLKRLNFVIESACARTGHGKYRHRIVFYFIFYFLFLWIYFSGYFWIEPLALRGVFGIWHLAFGIGYGRRLDHVPTYKHSLLGIEPADEVADWWINTLKQIFFHFSN